MLRASIRKAGGELDLRGVVSDADPRVEHGRALVALATALVRREREALARARDELCAAAGAPAAAAAIAVAATFEMMNRIVDGTGLPINPATRGVARELGLEALAEG